MRINNTRKSDTCSIIAWRSLSTARRNLRRPPGGTPLAIRRQPLTDPLLQGLSPGGSHLAPRCHAVQEHPCCSYRLAVTPVPPSAIPVAHQLLF
ncbi:hypothetical protein DEO72_LG3g1201 [Vigna unguiculata]|uniref:Uncharacterized protein n=1 Tax=Vigna unguiculata TaxID=3917 RepID=A0A4D6LDL9_VIGUN|nr:hypothetical protein DEO72_LG3g1201 [Vigna unguiculata]